MPDWKSYFYNKSLLSSEISIHKIVTNIVISLHMLYTMQGRNEGGGGGGGGDVNAGGFKCSVLL